MKISVIVPVYNVETYLRSCVDSILASTYTDFELILIDDGSTDSTGAMCDEYASHDSRVHVIHQDKKGVSIARNSGIEQSSGEYVSFVDADDVVSQSMLQQLLDALEKRPSCDFSMGRADAFHDGTEPELDRTIGDEAPAIVEYSQEQYMSYLFRG